MAYVECWEGFGPFEQIGGCVTGSSDYEAKTGDSAAMHHRKRCLGRLIPGSSFAVFDGVHILRRLTLATSFACCWMLFFALTPWWIGNTIDAIVASSTTVTDIVHRCAVLLAIAAGGAVAILAEERTSMLLRVECEVSLMRVLSRRTSNLGVAPSAYSAVNLGMVDISSVANGVSALARGIGGLIAVLLVGGAMLATSWQLGLVILVGAVIALISNDVVLLNYRRRQVTQRKRSDDLTQVARDIGGGARVIRGLGAAQTFLQRYAASSQALQRSGTDLSKADAQASAFRGVVSGIYKIVTVAVGAKLALSGTITVGNVVTAYGYTVFLSNPLNYIMRARQLRAAGVISQQRIEEWLADNPISHTPAVRQQDFPAALKRLESVIGASITPGAYTGVTSLDVRDWHATSLELANATFGRHQTVQIVGTEDYLFSGTLREVLTPPCDGLGDNGFEDVERQPSAVAAAMASDILAALPDGVDSDMTAGAMEFSGGERQRLRLARALSTAPEVLVLVDPTAALDVSTESAVVSRIRELRAGRTTVVLTHSVPHLVHADRVVVLGGAGDDVAAVGTHRDLLQLPEYRGLVRRLRGEA